jgi:hypothetical protein
MLDQRYLGAHDGKAVVHTQSYTEGSKARAKNARDRGLDKKVQFAEGDMRLLAEVPMIFIHKWMKESGIHPSNTRELDAYILKKIQSGEFDKFKVWNGKETM